MNITADNTYLVEPRDTLVVRDARPAENGVPMRSVAWPWPTTVAGFARTRAFTDPSTGRFDLTAVPQAKVLHVAGPWLVRLQGPRQPEPMVYVPAPRDVVWIGDPTDHKVMTRYALGPIGAATGTDLAGGELVGFLGNAAPKGKPVKPPAFWSWEEMASWLTAPARAPVQVDRQWSGGLPALVRETRTHVAMDAESQTAADGQLFSVESLRFERDGHRYGVGFACERDVQPGVTIFGGERRVSYLARATRGMAPAPISLPETGSRRVRLVLLTPAIFDAGYRPSEATLQGMGAKLVAWAVDRPQAISGWDFEANGPKKSRRVVPAGSVYWLEIEETPAAWASRHQLTHLADRPQDARDGFGLFAVGVE